MNSRNLVRYSLIAKNINARNGGKVGKFNRRASEPFIIQQMNFGRDFLYAFEYSYVFGSSGHNGIVGNSMMLLFRTVNPGSFLCSTHAANASKNNESYRDRHFHPDCNRRNPTES